MAAFRLHLIGFQEVSDRKTGKKMSDRDYNTIANVSVALCIFTAIIILPIVIISVIILIKYSKALYFVKRRPLLIRVLLFMISYALLGMFDHVVLLCITRVY